MYHFSVTVHDEFDAVVARAKAALADHGFGVLSEIDVASTLKAKIGAEMDPYLILGACNPPLAHQAITADPSIGVLLPCNVVVRQMEGDGVMVDFMDPEAVLDLVRRPDVERVAGEVRTRLEMVRDAIATGH
jgi:uncharacterized protein (DUF302 family)